MALFIEAIPDPAILVLNDGTCVAANSAATRLLPGLRIGGALVLGLRAPDVLDSVRRAASEGKTERAFWNERVPVERLYEVHVAPVDAAKGGAEHNVLLTLKDLTEARRLERMRTDFIANASHELRTPLASMLGFIDTLQGPARDDRAARDRFLRIMAEQGRRMARLIDDLLSLSRIEQNQYLRPETEVDLAQIAQSVCESMSQIAKRLQTKLIFEGPQSAVVLGDRDELVRVVENLIDNALKYGTRSDPTIANEVGVRVSSRDGTVVLSVSDNGPGIAAEHLPRLTERFYRVDVGQSRGKNGTGLGLAIVKHILVRHRGRFLISSAENVGTTFSVELPQLN